MMAQAIKTSMERTTGNTITLFDSLSSFLNAKSVLSLNAAVILGSDPNLSKKSSTPFFKQPSMTATAFL